MIEPGSTNRASRNRRVVALMAWGGLVLTTFFLSDARQSGGIRSTVAEPICFLLASFAAIVGVFAWILFNPNRRSARESPSLFFAAAATLFPPPIIGFCLMPAHSPLRGWLAFAVFMLCVIAVLSHIPDVFVGVPRGRHTYLTPIPAFDRVADSALDPNAAWFEFKDLSRIVEDTERPSLAPRSYLQQERIRPESRKPATIRPASDVDDILGADFDLSLLDDAVIEDDIARDPSTPQPLFRRSRGKQNQPRPDGRSSDKPDRQQRRSSNPISRTASRIADEANVFPTVLPVSAIPLSPQSGRAIAERSAAGEDLSPGARRVSAETVPPPTAEQRAAEQRAAEQRAVEQRAVEQRAVEQRAVEQRAVEQRAVEQRAVEQRAAEQRAVEQRAVEQRAAEERATKQREAEQPQSEASSPPELNRTHDELGGEVVEGVIKVRFDKGQKRANLHVPFSPPLATMPDVECECVGDETLRLKVPVRQSYGIRIEARRSNADESLDTEVGFAAVCPPE